MYALVYKCDLESIAFELLKSGETSHESYVVLSYTSGKPAGDFYPARQVLDALKEWKNDEAAQSMLVFPIVPYFGCGYSYESYVLRLICVFDKYSRYYRPSLPCEKDSDCSYAVPSDRYKNSVCGWKLCWRPLSS
ncbi:hypothetical protein Q1695_004214 [Nippostrongylus brasiliensis]|nr:hypothetical protein Q1695_004214 [Nippostrongylus brasiliensis]